MEFGPLPQKRELPPFVRELSAEDLALRLTRLRSELEASHATELEAARKEADRLAERLGLLVHKMCASHDGAHSPEDSIARSLRQLLKSEDIDLVTYVGEEVTETLELETDIVEWLPPDEESKDQVDRVVEALEPEIRRKGRLLHHAKLSCRQGTYDSEQAVAPEGGEPQGEPQAVVSDDEGASTDAPQVEQAVASEEGAPQSEQQEQRQAETASDEQKSRHNSRRARARHAKRRKKRR